MRKLKMVMRGIALCTAMFVLTACGSGASGAASTSSGSGDDSAKEETADTASSDSAATSGDTVVWKIGTAAGGTEYGQHPYIDGLMKFKEIVEEKSGGRYQIEIYPSSQLGNQDETTEAVSQGVYPGTVVTSWALGPYCDGILALEFPYLFDDIEHHFRVMNSDLIDTFNEELEKSNMFIFGSFLHGNLNITNSVRAIKGPEDYAGLKIRVQDVPPEIEALALLGANSTIIAWSETLTGLQQKTVDGVITSNAGFYTGNIGSIQDHFTDNNMFIESGAFVMCKSYWDSLPAEDQEMLTECMKETMEWSQQSAAELDATDLTKTVEEGQLELVKEDEFDRAACEELFAPLYEKYEAQYGEIWDKVEALK